jgi:hypothetical protein
MGDSSPIMTPPAREAIDPNNTTNGPNELTCARPE